MAGLYFHIPFCRKRCHYCDFYKTTELQLKSGFLDQIIRELEFQRDYLKGKPLETLYFGGGTPGLLNFKELSRLMERVQELFSLLPGAEVTLEVNPDDINRGKPAEILASGINRLSIGIQSFHDPLLKMMNRRHTAYQAVQAVETSFAEGFNNISIDLIYGIPGMTISNWNETLDQALILPVNHISAYHLTYHEGTPFYNWLKEGRLTEVPEDESLEQFRLLISKTAEAGFEQYEISSFGREKSYSQHNLGYWLGSEYLGVGPSAHSYNGFSRQWNIADIHSYIKALEKGIIPFESEILTDNDRLNDYIITRLRTKWGISPEVIRRDFGEEAAAAVMTSARPFLERGALVESEQAICLSPAGIMISDSVMAALMTV